MCANFQRNLRRYGFFLVDLVWNDPVVAACARGMHFVTLCRAPHYCRAYDNVRTSDKNWSNCVDV